MQNTLELPTTVPHGQSVEVRRKPGRPPKRKISADAKPMARLESSPLVNSQSIHGAICQNQQNTFKVTSGASSGDQAPPVAVRRKPGRPPKRKLSSDLEPARPKNCNVHVNLNAIDLLNSPHNRDSISNAPTINPSFTTLTKRQLGKVRRKPGRPRKQKNALLAGPVEQDWTTTPYTMEMHSSTICIPNQNDNKYLLNTVDSLAVISTPQSQTACSSDSLSKQDNCTEVVLKRRGRPKTLRPASAEEKTLASLASSPETDTDGEYSRNTSKKRGRKTRRWSGQGYGKTPELKASLPEEDDRCSLSGPAVQQHADMRGTFCSGVAANSGGGPPKTNRSMDVNGSDGAPSQNHTWSGQSTGTVKNIISVKEEDIEMDLNRLHTRFEGNYHESLQSVDKTYVKSEFPSSIDPTNKHRISVEHEQPNTSRDPRESHQNTLERSRYGRKRSLKGPLKRFKLDQESEHSTNLRFQCKQCSRSYNFMSQYILHERSHSGEKPFPCHVCGKCFAKKSTLCTHVKTHKSTISKYPRKLKMKCLALPETDQHSNKVSQEADKGVVANSVIKSDAANSVGANRVVIYSVVANRVVINSVVANSVAANSAVAANSDADNSVGAHTVIANSVSAKAVSDNRVSANGFRQSVALKKRNAYPCQHCKRNFPARSTLERHMHVHAVSKPYSCDVCGKGFCQHYSMCLHQLGHWPETCYNCTYCGMSFTDNIKAKDHVCCSMKTKPFIHMKGKSKASLSYTCVICKKTFLKLTDFYGHVKAHSSSMLYRCLSCGKRFTFQSEYDAHGYYCKKPRSAQSPPAVKLLPSQCSKRLVTPNAIISAPASNSEGEKFRSKLLQPRQSRPKEMIVSKKPFHFTVIPQHCSHFVSTLNNLDERSDPRKYPCPHCGRLFRHMGRLRAHMLTHARGQSYTCGCCGKTFESWTKLWRHQRIHRQRRGRFTCPQCGQGFRFVGPYKRHMAEHPEYRWVQRKSKKTPLPYQCELCCTGFETLDLLFGHQSGHFSEVHKDYTLDALLDGHSPPESHNEPQCDNMDTDPSLPVPGLQESIAFKCPPRQRFDSSDSVQPIDSLEKTLQKKQISPHAVTSEVCDGSPEDIKCVVCGRCYPVVSELHLHYLQHARGQL